VRRRRLGLESPAGNGVNMKTALQEALGNSAYISRRKVEKVRKPEVQVGRRAEEQERKKLMIGGKLA
jgi:hypothetical protein